VATQQLRAGSLLGTIAASGSLHTSLEIEESLFAVSLFTFPGLNYPMREPSDARTRALGVLLGDGKD
jgi:hypothetical protein